VPRSEIDDFYLVRPYYIVPDGKVGHDAYAVIRETIRSLDKVALARVVLTNREHVIAVEARDKGLIGMLLRYPYEVRDSAEYFDDIQAVKITKDMAGSRQTHRRAKVGAFRTRQVRGSLREGAAGPAGEEAEGPAYRLSTEGFTQQRRQPDGCATREDQWWQIVCEGGRGKTSEEGRAAAAGRRAEPASDIQGK
jgi:hypothetical protein